MQNETINFIDTLDEIVEDCGEAVEEGGKVLAVVAVSMGFPVDKICCCLSCNLASSVSSVEDLAVLHSRS